MEPITSTRNPRVAALAALSRSRVRRERGEHLVEGPHAVGEALAAGVVRELLVVDGDLKGLTVPDTVPVTAIHEHVLERIAGTRTPQGIVAVAATRLAVLDEVVGRGLLVVLHAVSDPGNAGAIVRSADAAGAVGVVCTPGTADVFGPKTVRAAAGSTYHLPVVAGVGLGVLAAACRGAGQRVVGLDASATGSIEALHTHTGPLALVVGNEAHGLPDDAAEHLDEVLAIPIHGRAESLNVAAAAAVALYAAGLGQRRDGPPR